LAGKDLVVKRTVKLGLLLLLFATLVPIIAANFQHDGDYFQFKWKLDREVPLDVKLAPVARADITRTIEAPGKVEADVEVKISAQVMGRITNLPVKEGDQVKDGDLVVQLDRVQFEADVRSAESRIQRLLSSIGLSETDLVKSRRDLDRNRRLVNERAVSRSDYDDMQTLFHKDQAKLAMVRSELVEAEAMLTRAREDLLRTTIRSPLKGIVSQLMAKEGEVVVLGTMNNAGTVIMSISDPNTMVVRARIDENSVAAVKAGQKALIHFQNNAKMTLTGEVMRISPKGIKGNSGTLLASSSDENQVATFETIISIHSPPSQIRLGMTASVEILVQEKKEVLTIPSPAVLHRRAKDLPAAVREHLEDDATHRAGVKDPSRRYHQVVFVESEGKAHCRIVKTGISDESRVEVLGGLEEGERVIGGPYRVFDNLKEDKPVKEATEKDEAGN
jgi:HlyD family secretion protein